MQLGVRRLLCSAKQSEIMKATVNLCYDSMAWCNFSLMAFQGYVVTTTLVADSQHNKNWLLLSFSLLW